jgi:hypothetical protein
MSRSIFVRAPSIVLATLVLATVPLAFTQEVRTEPRHIQKTVAQPRSETDEALANVLNVKPQMPRGPVEVLREYEDQMSLISQTFSAEIGLITQAVYQGQVTRAQAEYLMQQRYQMAMMQYEVLNALHDSLAFDLSRTSPAQSSQASEADTTVVVQPPVPAPSRP